MALPKYKTSRANTHSRRANWKATAAATVNCPNCGWLFVFLLLTCRSYIFWILTPCQIYDMQIFTNM